MKAFEIINGILIGIFSIATLLSCLYLGAKIHPVMGVFPSCVFLLISSLLESRESCGWGTAFGLLGAVLYFSIFFSMGFWQIRVIHRDDAKIEVIRGFNNCWGKSMAVGVKIDTLSLAQYYKTSGSSSVFNLDGYLLTEADSSFALFNNTEMVCEGYDPTFSKRDFGKGELDVVKFRDKKTGEWKTVDMRGKDINAEGYKPYERDDTPTDDIVNPYV